MRRLLFMWAVVMMADDKAKEPPKIDLHIQLRLANVQAQILQLQGYAAGLKQQIEQSCGTEHVAQLNQQSGEWECIVRK